MQPSIVTLTTDFGIADHYVGTMKGVILSRCPQVQLVDISHEIRPFSIHAGAYTIAQAAPYFPPGTIHVVVVDPGVGTERKPLLIEALGQCFIAPDNGVLTFILSLDPNARVREISNRSLWLLSPSATFHGRDVFAPTAAAIASGEAKQDDVGPQLDSCILLADWKPKELETGVWHGAVLSVDHFGNVITSFPSRQFNTLVSGQFALSAGNGEVTTLRATFAEAPRDLSFAYAGSSGYLELAINQGNAAQSLDVRPGDSVRLKARL